MDNSSSSTHTPRTWLITGASSGIGLSLARAAAERGDNVFGVARHLDSFASLVDETGGRVHAGACDVTDPAAVDRVVKDVVDAFGRIDVVVPLAGVGLWGGVEEASPEQAQEIFDINVQGTLNTLRSVLPTLRRQGSGHILAASSFLGMTASPADGLTAGSKYAIEGISQALIGELAPLGIHVTIVEPGLTATSFFANMRKAAPLEDYEQTVGERRKRLAAIPESAFNTPDRVAAAMVTAVAAENPPVRLPTGSFALNQMKAALAARIEELDAVAELAASVDTPAEATA